MESLDWFWLGLAVGIFIACCVSRSSYYNGVTDGYGYSVDPRCPGYWQAGRYLRAYVKHRWPEVMHGAVHDPSEKKP